jgi:hypothetical protein
MATVAVKPCRNGFPPTGPISSAQKKPASASLPSALGDDAGVVVRVREHVRPAPVAGEEQRRGRRHRVERVGEPFAQVLVLRARVAHVEAERLPDADRGRGHHRLRGPRQAGAVMVGGGHAPVVAVLFD